MPPVCLLFALALSAAAPVEPARLTVHADQPGITVSPLLYGIFFEEINRAGDGGLYAEMLQNRSFEDGGQPEGWQARGAVQLAIDRTRPLNDRNPAALRLDLTGEGAVVSGGFKNVGLALRQGAEYRLSLWLRGEGEVTTPLIARLENSTGRTLTEQRLVAATGAWRRFETTLTPGENDPAGRLVLTATGQGQLWLDQVSLKPAETWRGHGLRTDLAELLAAMKPAFVRFPGGCFVEGDTMADAERWKDTIGPLETRRGHRCIWGYRSTGGFGVHEFLQWCEDLGAEPLYVINCGMAHRDFIPLEKMDEFVQDALDLVEYARGPVTSKWGAERARNGHPEPFRFNYLQIGNENGGPRYRERYALFHDALKAKYPDLKLVACNWGGVPDNRPLDIIDDHYYNTPEFFIERIGQYDNRDRGGAKIYVGEYAVTRGGCGQGNLNAAIGEAVFMCGLERNSDLVVMASYAPLLVNPAWRAWNPNAIVFDQGRAYGTPSYWVQALFANHRAETIVPLELTSPITPPAGLQGQVGVGTWRTQAEFKDLRVVDPAGRELFASDFSAGTRPFRTYRGAWTVVDGALRQTSDQEGPRALVGDPTWGDYTLTLKARKLSGAEGFLILFHVPGDGVNRWWNLGGWGNSRHALEAVGGDGGSRPGQIETGRWYDIRLELTGDRIRGYLDGQLLVDVTRPGRQALYGVAGLAEGGREVVLKVVNVGGAAVTGQLDLRGLTPGPTGRGWVLTSADVMDENSFDEPLKVAPREFALTIPGPRLEHAFPAHSVTVLRVPRQ